MKTFLAAALFASAIAVSPVFAQTEPAAASPAPDAKAHECVDCLDCHGDEGEALRKVEQDWADAVAKHDLAAIERIEADEFIATDPSGSVTHKADDLEMAKSGELKISNFQLADMKVSIYGDAAVVTGKTTFRASVSDRPLGGDYRWTDVFVRRDGRWQAVVSQATAIAPQQVERTGE